ncbi:MAG: cobyric acid synthase [Lachnospiraceae bacterium]|nr:cobyric acid synthase [Lachnospiraceae bacterium]
MSKVIMIQGTMSNAGKSLLVAGLCRIFRQDGYRVAPFKSQNMALNSYITEEGLEMGRAQVMQAEAAGMKPLVCMNPILLKPTNQTGSQVIVNGEVLGNMSAREYFACKRKLIPDIKKAFLKLEELADIIVIEGAGSPAEINLKENDIVNMGMAQMVDAPVLLVGDIDRGGVFAQLLGTLMLLTEEEKSRVKGLFINKFRGDKTILDPGIEMLEERGGIPVLGVIPYMNLSLDDEDSLSERFSEKKAGCIDIAVIRYPRISNFTDFNVFEQQPDVSVRYVTSVSELKSPDILFLPGSKNTMSDLKWMRQNGLEAAVKKLSEEIPVFGICGGYQMLGYEISDNDCVEEGGTIRGMELLPVVTALKKEKRRCQVTGALESLPGVFACLNGMEYEGYEIHMGTTEYAEAYNGNHEELPVVLGGKGNVYGSYVHGLFDRGEIAAAVIKALAEKKGITLENGTIMDYQAFKETQYDILADTLRQYLNMEEIYGILREAKLE